MYRKNLVFIAACLGMLLFGMVFLSLGTVTVFIQEKFTIDSITAASLASSLPLGILAGSVLFGPVTDRFGYKILLVVSTGFIFIAFELIAAGKTVPMLQASFFLIGLAGGIINGVTNALVADISTNEKSSKLSLLGVFYGLGALGMPAVIAVLSKAFSYETMISVIGWFVILPMFYFLFLRFPEPKVKQGFPLSQAFRLFRDPVLILMGFILFFESALEGITGNWTTTYLRSMDFSVKNALIALSVQVAALAAARLLLSRILTKYNTVYIIYISFVLILAGSVILLVVSSFTGALLSMIFLGSGFAAVFPVILGMVGDRYPAISGTAFSLVIVMALAGNSLINYLTGVISGIKGIGIFPYILITSLILMLVIYRILTGISSKNQQI